MLLSTEALVTAEGKPFVAVYIDGERKGQLTPHEVQMFGMRCIQSGIEAERDAGFLNFMLSIDNSKKGLQYAGAMLHGMREHRQQVDPEGFDAAEQQRDEEE